MRRLGALLVLALVLAGCSRPSLSSLPAPAAVGGPTYALSADFTDVQNLPAGAKVKLDGTTIGQVDSITTSDYVAHVGMAIQRARHLPVGTTAQVRFTTPLGELYIALTPPAHPSGRMLVAGQHLYRASTSTAPTIEDTFAALSLLINGGGLTQIGSIVDDLNEALKNNTAPTRDLLARVQTLVTDLNAHRGDFDRALDSLDALTTQLAGRRSVLDAALTTFPPAIRVLRTQTTSLRAVASSVTTLSQVATDVLDRSTDDLVADIGSARTVLQSLASVSRSFVPVMQGLRRFGGILQHSAPGDYLTAVADVTLDFDSPAILPSYRSPGSSSSSGRSSGSSTGTSSGSSSETSSGASSASAAVVPKARTQRGAVAALVTAGGTAGGSK